MVVRRLGWWRRVAASRLPGVWTLRLLADRLVRLDVVESVSRETVRRTLKKTNLSLG
jgi:hypothetical protein